MIASKSYAKPGHRRSGGNDGDLDCGVDCGGRLLVVLHLYREGIMMELRYLMQMIGAVAISFNLNGLSGV